MATGGSKVVLLNLSSNRSKDDRQAAITRLFENHELELRRFLRNSLANQADVDDLVQDVFYRVLRDDRALEADVPRAYLYRVARNLLIDRFRKNKMRSTADKNRAQYLTEVSKHRPGLNSNEMAVAYRDALAKLPRRCRKVFLMRSYDGLTNKEIAEILGLSVRMVQKHLAKAMSHFHDMLCKGD